MGDEARKSTLMQRMNNGWFEVPFWYVLTVIVGAVMACGIAFALLPMTSPFGANWKWWHCSVSCSIVFVPLNLAYIGGLVSHFVFAG